MHCKYCGGGTLITHKRAPHIGLYCASCYRWQKWIPQYTAYLYDAANEYEKAKIEEGWCD